MKKLLLPSVFCLLAIGIFSCQTQAPLQPEIGFVGEALSNSDVELVHQYNAKMPRNWTTITAVNQNEELIWADINNNRSLGIFALEKTAQMTGWYQRTPVSNLLPESVVNFSVDIQTDGLEGAGVIIQVDGYSQYLDNQVEHNLDGGHSCGGRNASTSVIVSSLEITESIIVRPEGPSKKNGFDTYQVSITMPASAKKIEVLEVSLRMLPETSGKAYFDNISVFAE